jgi:2-polyprenyl-3-methyl-5-hydroxy-6-metoxy-1,4-benzoquinol methylase
MKSYKSVVQDRYETESTEENDSIYSPNSQIGKYSRKVIFRSLKSILDRFSNEKGNLTILDVGCGKGTLVDFFLSEGFTEKNIYGIDLSSNRINQAKTKYPSVNFVNGDALELTDITTEFDVITTFDLYSHFISKEEIIKGLKAISSKLKDTGTFIWYDINTADHFSPPSNIDSWGFSMEQMKSLGKEAGFEVVKSQGLFKLFFNKYHSVYRADKTPHWLLTFLEKIMPGKSGNNIVVFKKKTK